MKLKINFDQFNFILNTCIILRNKIIEEAYYNNINLLDLYIVDSIENIIKILERKEENFCNKKEQKISLKKIHLFTLLEILKPVSNDIRISNIFILLHRNLPLF